MNLSTQPTRPLLSRQPSLPALALLRTLLLALTWLLLTPSLPRAAEMADDKSAHDFPFAQTFFETVGDSDVIPEGAPIALAQDARGKIWIGTEKGLVEYDGYRFRKFLHADNDPTSLAGNFIKSLWAAPDGRIWVGTASDGVSIFDPATEQFSHLRHEPGNAGSLGGGSIWAMAGDARGGVWIATDEGLDHWPGRAGGAQVALIHYRHQANNARSLLDNGVRSLLQDQQGRLWVGTVAGLQRLAGKDFDAPMLKGQEVLALLQARDGKLWVGTREHGARWLDPASGKIHSLHRDGANPALPKAAVNQIAELPSGQIWLSTMGGGIVVLAASDGRIIHYLQHDDGVASSLAVNKIVALLLDRSGLLWVGTYAGGLQRYNSKNQAIQLVRRNQIGSKGLSHGEVFSILELPGGQILVGTGANGIDIIERQQGMTGGIRPAPPAPTKDGKPGPAIPPAAFPPGAVTALLAEPNQSLWVAIENNGLYQRRPGSNGWQHYSEAEGLPDPTIFSLLQGPNGVLWVGTYAGLAYWDATRQRFAVAKDASGNPMRSTVNAMTRDNQGRIWVASHTGLWMVDAGGVLLRGTRHDPKRKDSLSSDTLLGVLTDKSGKIFVSSVAGLDSLRGWDAEQAHFEHLTDLRGPSAAIIGEHLLQDRAGRIWSAEFVYDPAKKRFYPLTRADGFDIGTSWIAAFRRTHDGLFLFGGNQGLAVITPEKFQPWDYQPPLIVSALKINGKAVAPGQLVGAAGHLSLSPEMRNFSIEFAALDFSMPKKLRYRYRLQGYDPDWIEADADHRSASYGNLWPGTYTLQVRASNRLGDFSPHELAISIHVLPAFWQTGWFALLMLLLFGGMIVGGHRWRTEKVRTQARLEALRLQALVDERTSDIVAAHKELAESHQELGDAHRHLQETQSQLVQSEKMAALGQLVANVAHEINTPLGAVKSSGSNIADALDQSLSDLPRLFKLLNFDEEQAFHALLAQARSPNEVLTSREERAITREIRSVLAQQNLPAADQMAPILARLRSQNLVQASLPLLRHPDAMFILQAADNIAAIINNAANINLAVARVSKIVFALKVYSRSGDGGSEDNMQPYDLREGLETVLTLYHSQIKQSTELVREFATIGKVLCRPDELAQVWTNLIHNALHAMNHGGTLTLTLARVGNEARVTVSDTGCGIDDAIRSRIFDAFFTTKPIGEGSGLGLDIVRKIIAKHHGRIEVQSKVGVGTTFSVFLPLANPD